MYNFVERLKGANLVKGKKNRNIYLSSLKLFQVDAYLNE